MPHGSDVSCPNPPWTTAPPLLPPPPPPPPPLPPLHTPIAPVVLQAVQPVEHQASLLASLAFSPGLRISQGPPSQVPAHHPLSCLPPPPFAVNQPPSTSKATSSISRTSLEPGPRSAARALPPPSAQTPRPVISGQRALPVTVPSVSHKSMVYVSEWPSAKAQQASSD